MPRFARRERCGRGDDRRRGRATVPALGWLAAAALVIVVAPTGWWVTDVFESDDDFCNACHLPDGVALHAAIREDFDARPPASLAALHASTPVDERPDSPAFRCIDCHGGTGPGGRARVKALSAMDTVLYLTGRFEEPDGMSWPLRDADCRRCHEHFEQKGMGFEGQAFHDLRGHNEGLDVRCVDCHLLHASADESTGGAGVDPDRWFLDPDHTRAQCARCHVEYAAPLADHGLLEELSVGNAP
jgi:hypothetical protein